MATVAWVVHQTTLPLAAVVACSATEPTHIGSLVFIQQVRVRRLSTVAQVVTCSAPLEDLAEVAVVPHFQRVAAVAAIRVAEPPYVKAA